MKTTQAIQTLENNQSQPATFISDPENGDKIIIGKGTETARELLLSLDFEAYNGEGPEVVIDDEEVYTMTEAEAKALTGPRNRPTIPVKSLPTRPS